MRVVRQRHLPPPPSGLRASREPPAANSRTVRVAAGPPTWAHPAPHRSPPLGSTPRASPKLPNNVGRTSGIQTLRAVVTVCNEVPRARHGDVAVPVGDVRKRREHEQRRAKRHDEKRAEKRRLLGSMGTARALRLRTQTRKQQRYPDRPSVQLYYPPTHPPLTPFSILLPLRLPARRAPVPREPRPSAHRRESGLIPRRPPSSLTHPHLGRRSALDRQKAASTP